jgi:hypothetical protein
VAGGDADTLVGVMRYFLKRRKICLSTITECLHMKSFDAYVKSGALQKTASAAVRDAAADALLRGLPIAGQQKSIPAVPFGMLRTQVKPAPVLVR